MNIQKLKNNPRLPKHIALIIDGNGRWAKKRGMVRMIGHKYGFENLKKQIEFVRELGIKNLSLYCFSAENWKRPKKEVDYLMQLFDQMLDEYEKEYLSQDVRVIISGDMTDERIPVNIRQKAVKLMQQTKSKNGFILNPCINYGGQQEVLMAVNKCIADGVTIITKEELEKRLYSAELLPLDFVIRTSGEQRTSNFMVWQAAYAEWSFPKTYWPAFTKNDLVKALKNYLKRERRFGAIKEDKWKRDF